MSASMIMNIIQAKTPLIKEGVRLGYCTMVLDTLNWLEAAVHLYESLGFVRTKPYYDNPLPDVVYWKLDLRGQDVVSSVFF
jgi:hypothetical protein